MKTRNITTFAAFAAASLLGVSAYAGPHTKSKPMKPVTKVMEESCITGDIGLDVVSEYIRHGIVMENQGFIIQPYADLHFRVAKNVGGIDSITVDLGIWNSMHNHRPLARGAFGAAGASSTPQWFEFDFQAGLTFNAAKFAISPYFKIYESPSDVFQNTYAVGINLAYDDRDLLGDFALHPYVLAELQLEGTSGNNFPLGGNPTFHGRGQYYEVGITPAHSYGDLTLSLPIKGGFGSGGFYLANKGFGFVSVGIDAAYALNFVPECLGKWSVHTGVTYYRLGGNNSSLLTNTGAAGLGPAALGSPNGFDRGLVDKNQIVFGGGLKVAF